MELTISLPKCRVTASSKDFEEQKLELTAAESRDASLFGQVTLMWPDCPQYKHKRLRNLLSLSSGVSRVKPICMGLDFWMAERDSEAGCI